MSSYLYFCSVGLRMCISCWELFSQILEKKLSFCCPQILKESSSSLSILACISCIKCRYLSGIKTKKHTKAPVSLCFSALEENNYMKETKRNKTFNQIWIRDPCNHRGIWSRVPLGVCSCSPSVAMTASEKRRSNIVYMLPSWCTWGLYGNQNDITWLWRTIRANQWDNDVRQK